MLHILGVRRDRVRRLSFVMPGSMSAEKANACGLASSLVWEYYPPREVPAMAPLPSGQRRDRDELYPRKLGKRQCGVPRWIGLSTNATCQLEKPENSQVKTWGLSAPSQEACLPTGENAPHAKTCGMLGIRATVNAGAAVNKMGPCGYDGKNLAPRRGRVSNFGRLPAVSYCGGPANRITRQRMSRNACRRRRRGLRPNPTFSRANSPVSPIDWSLLLTAPARAPRNADMACRLP
jgi:hypothetical protein